MNIVKRSQLKRAADSKGVRNKGALALSTLLVFSGSMIYGTTHISANQLAVASASSAITRHGVNGAVNITVTLAPGSHGGCRKVRAMYPDLGTIGFPVTATRGRTWSQGNVASFTWDKTGQWCTAQAPITLPRGDAFYRVALGNDPGFAVRTLRANHYGIMNYRIWRLYR